MTPSNPQQELLASIGHKLRTARESQGLSVQQIAARIRIQAPFLEKIEQGVLEGMPGISFLRGFIRNYAEVLGLDDPELVEQLKAMVRAVEATPPPPMKPTTERLLDAEKTAGLPWPRIILVGLLTLLALWVGYLLVRVFLPSDSAYEPAAPQTQTAQAPAPVPAPQAPAAKAPTTLPPGTAPLSSAPPVTVFPGAVFPNSAAPRSAPGAAPGKPASPASVQPGFPARPVAASAPAPAPAGPAPSALPGRGPSPLRVTLRGLEDTWVRYAVDRKPPLEILMRTAESAALDADEEVRMTIGRSHGVSVYLNGEEVVLPGGRDRLVADLVLNKLTLLKVRN
jgi:cytoskeleton protein RodZ